MSETGGDPGTVPENLPITGALFAEFEHMLDDALWALAGFPSEPAYTRKQLDAIDAKMAFVGDEIYRIKAGIQYRRRVLKNQGRARVAASSAPHNASAARGAKELAAHLAEVHGLADVPVAGLTAAHLHSFGAHPEQARGSCAAFVRPSVSYHLTVLIARNTAAAQGEQVS